MNPNMIDPQDVELPAPPACPTWCTDTPGHDWINITAMTDHEGRPWFSRWHETEDLAVVDTLEGERFTLNIQAQELINVEGDLLTEPPMLALSMPNEYQPMTADTARALAAALNEVADGLDSL